MNKDELLQRMGLLAAVVSGQRVEFTRDSGDSLSHLSGVVQQTRDNLSRALKGKDLLVERDNRQSAYVTPHEVIRRN